MNLTMIRSGHSVFAHAECIKGYSFKVAFAREESIHFSIAKTATGSSFISSGAAA